MAARFAGLRVCAALLAAAVITGVTAEGASANDTRGEVVVLSLSGVVDPFMASYVVRGVTRANVEHDAAVLVRIDTPGGLDSSMRRIVQVILRSGVPVICYTAPSGARAASAGTFIMLACPLDAMAPGTNIGAAHPVGVSGVIEQDKVTNDAAAFIRSLAERWRRNADWAERAVRDSISASAEEALRVGVVDVIAASDRAVLDAAGGCGRAQPGALAADHAVRFPRSLCGARLTSIDPSLAERVFHSFADPNVAFLFVNLGFLALLVWLVHPAFHVALAVGVVLSVLGLLILETLPVRLGGLVLLATAIVLFVVDVKAKAHGVLTAGGLAVFVIGGLLLFNPAVPNAQVSRPLLFFTAALVGLFALVVLRALVSVAGQPARTGIDRLAGTTGVAITPLTPTGLVRAGGESWSAASVAGAVPAGAAVRVVGVRGLTLEVAPEPNAAESVQHG